MPNRLDRNANSLNRLRRNMQRLAEGAAAFTIPFKVKATTPLTGGGFISTSPTIAILQAGSTASGYLSSTDWNLFYNSAVGSYLSTGTFLSTTAPIAGAGFLSTGLNLSMPQVNTSTNGWLSSTDWNTFNGKQAAGSYLAGSAALTTTVPLTGGGNLSTGLTLSIVQASSTTNGYLSSTDWTTFNRLFGASGVTHQFGNVPDPGSTAGTGRFLREDATWATPAGGGGTTTPTYALKNRIINGNFDIWQRGTTFGSAGVPHAPCYTADRWYLTSTAGVNGTAAIQELFGVTDLGSTNAPYTYYAQLQSGSSGGQAQLEQRIEGVRTLAGCPAVLSCWLKGVGTPNPSVAIIQFFGAGGSATVTNTIQIPYIGAVWTFYSTAITLGSLSGKTIGTGGDDYLSIQFQLSGGYDLNIARVQLEPGTACTDFEYRPPAMELALCERYYSQSYQRTDAPGTITGTGAVRFYMAATNAGEASPTVFYAASMRTVPTLAFYSPVSGAVNNLRDLTASVDVSMTGVNQQGVRSHSGGPNLTATHVYSYHYTANAEL